MGKRPNLLEYMREQLGDLADLFPFTEAGDRVKDSAIEAFMKHGFKLIERFVGDPVPKTPKERRHRRILESATELFIQQGYRKTSMDEVARKAGVAKGTVYLYFKTKADLLMHAIALEKYRYVGGVLEVLQGDLSPREKLRAYLKGVLILVNEMPLVASMARGDHEILNALEDIGGVGPLSAFEMQASFIGWLVKRAAPRGSLTDEQIDARAHVLIGLMYIGSSLGDDRLRGGLSLDDFAGTLVDMLIDGIPHDEPRSNG